MQFRVSRNDQEYGPYTLEELQQYVSEGSILPADYVFNGMEWMQISQFLQGPQKALMASQSISSIANAAPQNNFSNTQDNTYGSKGKSKLNLKSIAGVMFVIALVGYNFFNNQNYEKAEKFHNSLQSIMMQYGGKLVSLDIEGMDDFKKWVSINKKFRQDIENLPFYGGKKGVGYKIKDKALEFADISDAFIKDLTNFTNQIERESSAIQNREESVKKLEKMMIEANKLATDFESRVENKTNQLKELQKQYAKNNGGVIEEK